jgi:predicted N-acetyltransferase YhbS
MHREPSLTPKKVRRRRNADEVVVEQLTGDAVIAPRIMEGLGCAGLAADLLSGCRLAAFRGDEVIGIAQVETRVDAAVIAPVVVLPSLRRQGVGTSLMQAARVAAHTRGAQMLFALSSVETKSFFSKLGFTLVPISDANAAAGQFRNVRSFSALDDDYMFMSMDISRDGVIVR